MKKLSSNHLRIATMVMGIALATSAGAQSSITMNANRLLCLPIYGESSNAALAVIRIASDGQASGTLCPLNADAPTFESCVAVQGIVTGTDEIRIGLSGVSRDQIGGWVTHTAALAYYPKTKSVEGSARFMTEGKSKDEWTTATVEGSGQAVECKLARGAKGVQKVMLKLPVTGVQREFSLKLPSYVP